MNDLSPAMKRRRLFRASWLRILGLILFGFLLTRVDTEIVVINLRGAEPAKVFYSIVLILPLIALKTVRWREILRAQKIRISIRSALLAYFASLFIGFLTPGRLGEFTRAIYVHDESHLQPGLAISSVLADRLFDLYALLLVGGAALLSFQTIEWQLIMFLATSLSLTVPMVLFLNERVFIRLQSFGLKLGMVGRKIFADDSWLNGMRTGLKRLTMRSSLISTVLTVLAYLIFFGQNYLLAQALKIPANFAQVMYAVALGSLVTLLPISISGIGTREAAITAFLGMVGVKPEDALSFSLLAFANFYIVGGLFGGLAWWIKPFSSVRYSKSAW